MATTQAGQQVSGQTGAVDGDALRAAHDGRWSEVRNEARDLLRRPELRADPTLDVDGQRRRVFEQLQLMAATRGPRLGFPETVGGEGDAGSSISTFSMLAYTDLALLVKAGVQWGLFGGAIQQLGTEEQQARWLPSAITAEVPGCFAMTETGHGSDVQSIRTVATYDPDRQVFVIHTPDEQARKDYIGNAAVHGRLAVVFAQLHVGDGSEGQGDGDTDGQGVHALVVPIRDEQGRPLPGVRIEDCGLKEGLNGVDNGRLAFDHVEVPRDHLLGRFGSVAADGTYHSPIEGTAKRFFTMLGTLIQGRVSVAGGALAAAKVALAVAVRYGEGRRQFEAPGADGEIALLDYRAHQRRLLPALAGTWSLHLAHDALVAELHEVLASTPQDAPGVTEERKRLLESRAAGVKALATWHAAATIQACREACGGAGYLAENLLPKLRADIDVFTTFEGDNTVLLQLVGKQLLSAYQAEFEDRDMRALVHFAADQAWDTVVEASGARAVAGRVLAAVPGLDDASDVGERDWQQAQFAWREKHLLDTLARRLRRIGEKGADAFTVFNEAQDHLLAAAEAHVERLVIDDAFAAVDRLDGAVAELLGEVVELHALALLERHRAWYLEHGRISAEQAKAVVAAVNDGCARLRPHARALVDGFGIPEECLGAAILR